MSDFNSLQTPRFDDWARRAAGIKQIGALGVLAGELVPVFTAPVGLEDALRARWPIWATFSRTGATNRWLRLSIPAGVPVLAQLEVEISFLAGAGMQIALAVDTAGATLTALFSRDLRRLQSPPVGGAMTNSVLPASATARWLIGSPIAGIPVLTPRFVLTPGVSVWLGNDDNVLGKDYQFNVVGFARSCTQDELTA